MPHHTFTLSETAKYLHLSRPDLDLLVLRREIPCEHKGRQIVFRKIELDAWASKRILAFSDKHLRAYHKTSSDNTRDLSCENAIACSLLRASDIHLGLCSRTKPSLLRDMAALAEKTGLVPDRTNLLESLVMREEMCSTALPDGLALLHPRHHDPYMFVESFIVFGRTIRPIPFGAPDGGMTDLFFLICCQNDRLHLHVLARLCAMCRSKPFLAELRLQTDPAGIHGLLQRQEREIIVQTGLAPAGK